MIEVVKPIYRYGTEDELTKKVEELLRDLEAENEGVIDVIMDMTLDHSERRDKAFWEVVKNPENYQELLTLQSRNNTLEYIISELKSMIYSDYETIPLTEKEHRMGYEECQIWLGTKVKPFILNGETKQYVIAEELNVPANTISNRVKIAFKKSWKEYVEFIEQGIY